MSTPATTAPPSTLGGFVLPQDPPVTVLVDGEELLLGGDTHWWLERLACADWWGIVAAMQPADVLERRLADAEDSFDATDAAQLAADVVRGVTAYEWAWACRLAAVCGANWARISGWAMEHGIADLLAHPPRVALVAAYRALLAAVADERGLNRLDRDLGRREGIPGPLAHGPNAVPLWKPQDEADDFMAAAAQFAALSGQEVT